MLVEDKRQPTHPAPTAEDALGMRFRRLREARGWSQDHVAQLMSAAGHSWRQTTVAKTEAAQRPIRFNEVADLMRIFNVQPDELLGPVMVSVTEVGAGRLPHLPSVDELLAKVRVDRATDEVAVAAQKLQGLEQAVSEAKIELSVAESRLIRARVELAEIIEKATSDGEH